jgi:A/G-specific adenine glycosylase
MTRDFSDRLLDWFDRHGRHDLPWQSDPTPYRVWVSEIMLQQTQVATVIPYFERFIGRFPDPASLADADQDEVLHLWSGLGYYSRARNLHAAARLVRDEHGGRVPESIEEVMALPGVGRSTAGAILALSRGQRHAILDGNVKRVLCRHRGVDGWPGRSATAKALWGHAERFTPFSRVDRYTQAIMDLGATVCRRSRPACDACPVSADCVARCEGRQAELPAPRPKRARPVRNTTMLVVVDPDSRVLLQRRPASGVWAGLWVFPEVEEPAGAVAWLRERLGVATTDGRVLAPVSHGFTHYELRIEPWLARVENAPARVMEEDNLLWYNPESPAKVGTAAVVGRLLKRIAADKGEENEPDGQVRPAGH